MSKERFIKKIGLRSFFTRRKNSYIDSYIESNCRDIIDRYRDRKDTPKSVDRVVIWVFWAQGIENAPDIIKMCNKNLHALSPGSVVNLDMNNFREYVDIPSHILDKVENKSVTLTHFSDILRFALLAERGGIWLDSTCWVSSDLVKLVVPDSIFTVASPPQEQPVMLPNGRWAVWTLGTTLVNSTLFSLGRDILIRNIKRKDILVDYFFIDHVIDYICRHFTSESELISRGAIDGRKCGLLIARINDPYQDSDFNKLVNSSDVFKLTYRKRLLDRTDGGELTIYGKLKEQYL